MKRPIINLWIIFQLGLILFFSLVLAAWSFRDVFFTPNDIAEKHPDRFDYFYIFNLMLFVISVITSILCVISIPQILMKKRHSWIWYIVMSVLVLMVFTALQIGMSGIVLLLISGVLIYFWMSQQNKLWYKILYKRK